MYISFAPLKSVVYKKMRIVRGDVCVCACVCPWS